MPYKSNKKQVLSSGREATVGAFVLVTSATLVVTSASLDLTSSNKKLVTKVPTGR